jgi:UDP-N-acetylglucosamine 2-epimerase
LRDETEWVETVELGWNRLVGTDVEKILSAVKNLRPGDNVDFSNEFSANKMVEIIVNLLIGNIQDVNKKNI